MGHIAFAGPGVDGFVLHERLQRTLHLREHRTTVLCLDAGEHAFWGAQAQGVQLLRDRTAADADDAPLAEFAAHDRASHHRTQRWLSRCLPAAERWFRVARPDLLLLHRRREPGQLLLQFVARRHGVRILWSGDGLLPHTLQLDERGLDGDASASNRSALDYRVVRGEPGLLQACLANALAHTAPCALPPHPVVAPDLGRRLRAAATVWRDRGANAAWRSLGAWRHAIPMPIPSDDGRAAGPFRPPEPAFVAVLLQAHDDARVRLDAGLAHDPAVLLAAAHEAVRAVDPQLQVVAVGAEPDLRLPPRTTAAPAHAAAAAVATAAAVITINHPLAAIALLAGTPVGHIGRALYGLRGVATRCALAELPAALAAALHHDHPTLRQRFLTWLFGYGHLWCSPTHPDHNGILGFVQAIEARLRHAPAEAPLRYRAGPAWPLAAPGRSH